MAYETRDNSGTLGRNDRATTDKHPSHKGKARIDGVDYWVSAWVKEAGSQSKNPGSKFFSLSFERVEQQDTQFGANASQTAQEPRSGHGGAQGMSGHERGAEGAPGGDYDDTLPF